MRQVKLCLHTGGSEVSYSELLKVATPAPTESWTPIPHHDLVERTRVGLANANLEVVNEAHALAKGGDRYFGLFQVRRPGMEATDHSLVLGLRNSHDKVFPAGLVAGSAVFVCDNLAFSGEVRLARKHTVNIYRDLPGKITLGIGKLGQLWVSQAKRFEAYKEKSFNDVRDVHDLLIRAIDSEACTVTQIKHVMDEYRNPTHEEFKANNVWRLFNAFTEAAKATQNLQTLSQRTVKLHALLDGYCGILEKDVIDIAAN